MFLHVHLNYGFNSDLIHQNSCQGLNLPEEVAHLALHTLGSQGVRVYNNLFLPKP